ncbi:restriction endonuclease [Burkholderia arboris]|uniref:restriction endonuclease n=1 Tax=Burkholderia arboris TaxID=488730 RepID=UPI001CF143A8|nr:restriction endonuclease [Burkholderia arboris]MCA8047511.1 restriction endonuclease [Burkholderia arboris]
MKKARRPKPEQRGIAFEKVVAAIQSQIDPQATVTHSEFLIDRLGHRRQFDIVVRGTFAGQQMLGIIECKDLGGKVGTPDVDAFVTKAQDINANFKVLVSRRGFTKPALEKCVHYGVQALSLIENDPANRNFFIGTRWEADVVRWGQVAVTLHFVIEPVQPVHFDAAEISIAGKKVIDWFMNYLLDSTDEVTGFGWVVNVTTLFSEPQTVAVTAGEEYQCSAISFAAERICQQLERYVGISGTGFYSWLERKATFPPGAQIRMDAVPMDFAQWQPRGSEQRSSAGFLEVKLEVHSLFDRVADAIQLDAL